MLQWLRTSPAARLLAGLAEHHDAVSHEIVDALPHNQTVDFLRAILVAIDILPRRQKQLDRLKPWLTSMLAGLPAHQLRYLRPFAEWEVLRKARRAAARGRYTINSASLDRAKVRSAVEFLAWVDQQHTDLPSITQSQMDRWITTGPPSRRHVHAFLRWTTAHEITTKLSITLKSSGLPTRFLDEEDHLSQLRRCLTDATLPIEVRIAGALVRLCAMPLTRIVELTADNFDRDTNEAFLTIGEHPVILPPSLATLIDQQLTVHQRNLVSGPTRYMFPGNVPNRPLLSGSLGERLLRHDLGTPAAHNTAMATLVTDLPALVVSDLIGINISTANQWLGYARTNWVNYLAARQSEERHRSTQSRQRLSHIGADTVRDIPVCSRPGGTWCAGTTVPKRVHRSSKWRRVGPGRADHWAAEVQ